MINYNIYQDSTSAGLVGFSLGNFNEPGTLLMDVLKEQGIIDEKIFTMFLGFNSTVTEVEEWSKIWIGEAIEPDKVEWLNIND